MKNNTKASFPKHLISSILQLTALCFFCTGSLALEQPPNVVLVTLDGVRWQEIFGGIDQALIDDERFTKEPELITEKFGHQQRENRREKLFPFLWSIIAKKGVLLGDRTQNSLIEVTNPWWFSYPGYNEILTGIADPGIDSNDKNWNKNTTILELLNNTKEFNDKVVAFGSWDVFPYIINSRRSKLPINAGFAIEENASTDKLRWLNESSENSPRLWSTVRLDYLTHGYALEALNNHHPRVTYIAYGETDDLAHDGSYDRYIDAANRSDLMLSKLWNWLQSDPFYRDRTTLIITTDHGRGDTPGDWQHHLSPQAAAKMNLLETVPDGVPGSDQIWFAAIGPSIASKGVISGQWKQSQIAATVLSSLRLNAKKLLPEADTEIEQILR